MKKNITPHNVISELYSDATTWGIIKNTPFLWMIWKGKAIQLNEKEADAVINTLNRFKKIKKSGVKKK